jgi:hypothetical protein
MAPRRAEPAGGGDRRRPDRLHRIRKRRPPRGDRASLRVQPPCQAGEVAADQLGTHRQPAQPAAHRGGRHAQLRRDLPVPTPSGLGQQRQADHPGQVHPTQQRHARQQHMGRLAALTAATTRTNLDPPGHIPQPPPAREPPPAKRTSTPGTAEHARGEVLLDPIRVGVYDQHPVRLAPPSTALSNC